MRRREFITILGGAAAWPIAARGQQSSIPVIGFINGSSATAYAANVQAFIRGLAGTGHTVGENVAIEYRWAEGHYDRIPDMVDDLVRRRVAVLAPNTPATHAAKRAAGNIPVVFFTGEDPVASGLVASLNRPGGNATGVTSLFGGLAAKQVGLLRDLVPAATLIGFLVNPRNPITERNVRDALDAAQKLGKKVEVVHASSEAEIDAAFDTLRGVRAGALLAQPDAFLINKRIVALAARDALPVMYQDRELVVAGGLMSYGSSVVDMYHQTGVYAGKVLKERKAGRDAGAAAHQIRNDDQSANGKGTRSETLRQSAVARGRGHRMRRREFITLLGGAAAVWPLTARAQQREQMRRIGVLMGYAESDREGQAFVAAFREGLQKLGWTEGRNVRIDTR